MNKALKARGGRCLSAVIFKLIFKELGSKSVSSDILETLKARIKEKRKDNPVSLIKCLYNPSALSQSASDQFFDMPTCASLIKTP